MSGPGHNSGDTMLVAVQDLVCSVNHIENLVGLSGEVAGNMLSIFADAPAILVQDRDRLCALHESIRAMTEKASHLLGDLERDLYRKESGDGAE